ncbi:hypothetical protein [Laspinema olomoucense]|uniref:Uncharacterized protein n=1 Tax=Laspinema olomoucense D3b TaxID=2953688 RepID=A0ABT2N523_9CYAN|nr:hypothetical protein [Laspinema sp. D3b]MCT7976860.1 hypothetical protein [Laspinema sp. D3b]
MPLKEIVEAPILAKGLVWRYGKYFLFGFLLFAFLGTIRSTQIDSVEKSWMIPMLGGFLTPFLGCYIANKYKKNK